MKTLIKKILCLYFIVSLACVFAQQNQNIEAKPKPDSTDKESKEYKVSAGDVLEIVILGEEELSRNLLVMHNGTISFPLIGDINAAGLTTSQVADTIASRLKKYFVQPMVSVILKGPTISMVSVYGEVLNPGVVEYQRGLFITDYIALAGGPTNQANLNRVRIVHYIESKPVVTVVNVAEVIRKGKSESNFELKAGDLIYIDKKFSINWTMFLQVATLALTVVNLYFTIENR